jgi:hypothetical protein
MSGVAWAAWASPGQVSALNMLQPETPRFAGAYPKQTPLPTLEYGKCPACLVDGFKVCITPLCFFLNPFQTTELASGCQICDAGPIAETSSQLTAQRHTRP